MNAEKIKLIFFTLWLLIACQPVEVLPPYPHSTKIKSIAFDWSSYIKLARGSDNWPITWAGDGNQYTSWGDGGGFGGSNSDGRVSLGVARIEGSAASYKAFNVWGGVESEHASQFAGKSYGIISLGGMLYKWVSPGSNAQAYEESRLYLSSNYAATWQPADWAFDRQDNIVNPAFCQYGKDYQDSRDNYVYIYANRIKDSSALDVQRPGETVLMRVPKTSLLNRAEYEYYTGLDKNSSPRWSKNLSEYQAVFKDENGVGWNLSVSYNPGLKRYLLMTENKQSFKANLGIFDAPEPWGPWTTVHYGKFDDESGVAATTFFITFQTNG